MSIGPAFPCYPVKTLRELLFKAAERYSDRPALKYKQEGRYRSISFRKLRQSVESLSTYLLSQDLRRGEPVALIGPNGPEWAIGYLGIVTSGLVAVPIDKELTGGEIRHIFDFAAPLGAIASQEYLQMLGPGRISKLKSVVSTDAPGAGEDLLLAQALAGGGSIPAEKIEVGPVAPEDLAAIIFTSGTTGAPKGVMLSHYNIAANVVGTSCHLAIDQNDTMLSVLPLHHTYECTAGFLTALYQGATIAYAESLRRVPENMAEVQASVMLGVPALFEAMYGRIRAGAEAEGKRRFRLACILADAMEPLPGRRVPRLLFRELHERLGGRLRLLISGGAALDPRIARGFRRLGIDFVQGYGMTENSPIIAVNRVDLLRDEAVGLPLPGTEVRMEAGEILVRGPSVMRGYYRNPEATREALEGGWLHTGDLGYLDSKGFLYLRGRKKSVIVLPNGKNVFPEELEKVLDASPFIVESLVRGGREPGSGKTRLEAILVPDIQAFDRAFGSAGYDEEKLKNVLVEEVRRFNRDLTGYKRVRHFSIRTEPFEKTTTGKIKRHLYTAKPQLIQA